MPDREQINVRVDADRKERWADYAEDAPNIENLSHLIRAAVHDYISDDAGETPVRRAETATGTAGEDAIEDLRDRLKRIENGIEAIQDGLGAVEKEVTESPSPGDRWVFSELPEGPDNATTVEGIAGYLGEPRQDIEQILERLADTTGRVKQGTNEDGETVFWKEVEG